MNNRIITVDTLDKRLALIAALDERIEKLTPMVERSDNAAFVRMFGQEIADLKAIVADLRIP